MFKIWIIFAIIGPSSILGLLRAPPNPPQITPPYTCDDIFGNDTFCDPSSLHVVEKSVAVRGVNMTYWTYQKLDAEPKSGKSGKSPELPVIMINGGPGYPHNYLLPLKQSACSGRKIVFYDQVGTGKSSVCPPVGPGENPNACDVNITHPYLFELNYYTEEVEALVEDLGLEESGYHIFGHSWGTIVAELFASTRPKGLASVVLGGALANSHVYIDAQWDPVEGNLGTLPWIMQNSIKKLEAAGDYDAPMYQKICEDLTAQFTVRTFPAPSCVSYCETVANQKIYVTLQGPSEFSLTPNAILADMNLTNELRNIDVPVLLTNGKYDTMRGPNIRSMANEIANVEVMMFDKSGHMTMVDEPVKMNLELGKWWKKVELASIIDEEVILEVVV